MGEYANKAIGRTKKVFGRITRNRTLQAKGALQETGGKAQGVGRRAGRNVRKTARRVSRGARSATSRVKSRAKNLRAPAGRPRRSNQGRKVATAGRSSGRY